jgi:hypothetical protein
MLNVFISYSDDDGGDLAEHLKGTLEKYDINISAFVAADDIDIGESGEPKIFTALNDCDVFVPILTVAACLSPWVRKEIDVALEKEKKIIPCVFNGVLITPEIIPDILNELQRITFKNEYDLPRQLLPVVLQRVLPLISPHKDVVACQVPKDAINARDEKIIKEAENEFLGELVEIYASYPLSKIKNSSEYLKLCEQESKNPTFNRLRNVTEQIKLLLEHTVGIQSSGKGQVSESLMLMLRLANDKDKEFFNYCRKLIIKAYSKNWNQEQLDYFERISDILKTLDYDYFLSFTRRKRSSGGYNPVNNNYEHFIKAILGRHRFTHKERIEKNLLAESIHKILRDCGYNGFFYPEHIGDNQPVDPKVEQACKNSHIFIQLIQDVMFDKPNVENYCFNEYNYVKDTFSEDQILFVLAEGSREKFVSRSPVCLDYLDWYDHFKRKDIVILEFTTTWKQKDIDLLKKKIEEKICNKIKEYKDHLINNVP